MSRNRTACHSHSTARCAWQKRTCYGATGFDAPSEDRRLTMSDTVRLALHALCLDINVIALLVVAVSVVQLPFNAKPNSYGLLFFTDKLTPRGRAIHRRLLIAVTVFLA